MPKPKDERLFNCDVCHKLHSIDDRHSAPVSAGVTRDAVWWCTACNGETEKIAALIEKAKQMARERWAMQWEREMKAGQ